MDKKGKEQERLKISANNKNWKMWGPYLAERQWGTVREDYSDDGNAWNYISHEKARSNAYRWGEEGIAGFCDRQQILCLAPAFWNGNDKILKERLFGLTNNQGNHGEDVKELYFHLDSSPTHSYCKYLYKYPHKEFPYASLVSNNQVSRAEPEFELLDTNAFKDSLYFDCFVEYAKADVDDILMKITIYNRGNEPATIHVIPQLWFRNYWNHNSLFNRPKMNAISDNCMKQFLIKMAHITFIMKGVNNYFARMETNNKAVYDGISHYEFVKDGINNFIINGEESVNPKKTGTKTGIWVSRKIAGNDFKIFKIRLSTKKKSDPWIDFEETFESEFGNGPLL